MEPSAPAAAPAPIGDKGTLDLSALLARPFLLPPTIAPVRSLRVKVLLVVTAVALLPQLLVALWSAMERNIGGEMEARADYVAAEVVQQLAEAGPYDPDAWRPIEELANVHGLRIRVVHEGLTLHDADADQGTDLVHQIGTLFFGPDGAPILAEFDATLEPMRARTSASWPTSCTSSRTRLPPCALPQRRSPRAPSTRRVPDGSEGCSSTRARVSMRW